MLGVRVSGALALLAVACAMKSAPSTSVVAKIAAGTNPCGIVGAAGSVWVSDAGTARLLRIDPGTNTVAGSFPLDRTPCEMQFAFGSIWVVTQSGRLDRVDPRTGAVEARIRVGLTTYEAAAALGSIWITNRDSGTVQRIDPRRNRVVKTYRNVALARPAGIVGAGAFLWIGDDGGRAIYRLNPRAAPKRRWRRIRTGQQSSSWMAASPGAVWVSNTASDSVSRIDPGSARAVATVKVCSQPVNLDVVGGDVWVPCDGDNKVARIDGDTSALLETISAGANTAVVAGAEGDVWVSNFEDGTVWRIRPG